MPTSPADLVAAEPDPRVRFRLITTFADKRWLSPAWSAQRLADLRTLLSSDPPVLRSEIADENQITRSCLTELAKKALGGSR
jgi:hypothetical protein